MPGEGGKINSIKVLKGYPDEAEALRTLERAANIVTPTLERRGWKVKLLTEFYPDNGSLLGLNVNRGQTIKVRLRTSESRDVFLPFEDVLGTLVHEITHNKIGPHSAAFYQLMEELYTEVEKDMANGLTTAGGGDFKAWSDTRPADATALRSAQATAALSRQRKALLTRSSGQTLGSGSTRTLQQAKSPRSMRADAAQHRKLQQKGASVAGRAASSEESVPLASSSPITMPLRPPLQLAELDEDVQILSHAWFCTHCSFRNTNIADRGTRVKCEMCARSFENEQLEQEEEAEEGEIECLGYFPSAPDPWLSVSPTPDAPAKRRRAAMRQAEDRYTQEQWTCSHCTFVNIHPCPTTSQSETSRTVICSMCGLG